MTLYKITNKINGSCYIGQTKRSLRKRWTAHCHSTTCSALNHAIQEYGAENFSIESIYETDSESEINKKEKEKILEFNTLAPHGYNIFPGGCRPRTSFKSTNKGKISYFKGRKHSEESKMKMAVAKKNYIPWNKGKTGIYSEEILKKMAEGRIAARIQKGALI